MPSGPGSSDDELVGKTRLAVKNSLQGTDSLVVGKFISGLEKIHFSFAWR